MILKALLRDGDDSEDLVDKVSDDDIAPLFNCQMDKKPKHGLKKKKTEAELGKDRNMVNILNNVHKRRFIEHLFEENTQNAPKIPPPANMLEELKAEIGLND